MHTCAHLKSNDVRFHTLRFDIGQFQAHQRLPLTMNYLKVSHNLKKKKLFLLYISSEYHDGAKKNIMG
jgi:hypothetical protein